MGEDATLDAFLGDGEQSKGSTAVDDGTGRGADQADESDVRAEPSGNAAVETATTTFAFAASGATCEECGDAVERRWQQEGALVCADCKDW